MTGFFDELKRRKVYRVAVAYAVAAAGLIQLASAVFPAWELPNWALRLVVTLLLVGFPIALILAWAFDVTPEGIKVTPSPGSPTFRSRRNLWLLLAFAVVASGVAGFFLMPHAAAARMDKSIAVLPFENFSDDKENAFFADGIQDDILTNLAKVSELKVISRTSVMMYRGKSGNVREIGKALGVSAILEGSVRKSGNRVRVNVQLINAANDGHIWAEDYDRDLTDVFAIQTDLAQKIARALQAKLSPSEKMQMTRKPTENGEAYLAFVQAHDLHARMDDFEKLKQAGQLYERALQLDPDFALASARYSQLQSWILHTFDPAPARREQARTLATRALELQPDLPEGHLALGFSLYYGEGNFEAAANEFFIAQKGLPNDAEVYLALGAIERRQGRWAESNAHLEKAAELNPKQSWALQNLALSYERLHQWKLANETLARALKIEPGSIVLQGLRAQLAIEERGDFEPYEAGLKALLMMPEGGDKWFILTNQAAGVRLLQRKYEEVIRMLEPVNDALLRERPGAIGSKYAVLGLARRAMKDEGGARAAFAIVKAAAQEYVVSAPNDADAHSFLASALALLGEKEPALAEMQRALDLVSPSKDAFHGPELMAFAAEVYVLVGEIDRAFVTLEELAKRPNTLTPELLKLNPTWDPIRTDPRFEPLLPKFNAKF